MTIVSGISRTAAIGLFLVSAAGLCAQGPTEPGPGPTTGKAQPPERKKGPTLPPGFAHKTITLRDGTERAYIVFMPPQYVLDKKKRWPLVVSLHGSGECGTDNLKPTRVGLPPLLAKRPDAYSFLAVIPQARKLWFRDKEAEAVWEILEAVHGAYRTDRDRVYLTGYSMGGYGTWELAMARPDVFAAIVPICGAASTQFVSNIRHLPVWAFHGALDKSVPVAGSQEPIAELKRLGASPKYTEYAKGGHNSWDGAYRKPELWTWLLEQRRKPPPRVIDYHFVSGSTTVWWLGVQAGEGLKALAHIHAEIDREGRRVSVRSEGVVGWAIKSETDPLKIGDEIEVSWNGEPVFKGEFTGGIAVKPRS